MRLRGISSFFGFVAGVLVALVVAFLVGRFDVPFATVVTTGMGALCLVWLVVIVVLPWNLYFAARHLLQEMQKSRARGIAVRDDVEGGTRVVAQRMLRISLALHVGTAALLGVGATAYGQPAGQVFAALFLLSTFFRPGVEYYRHLRRQLAETLNEVRYPREDVVKLVDDVRTVVAASEEHARTIAELRSELHRVRAEAASRSEEHKRKLDAVARRFEETIDRLTDNQEIIAGIKAFLRLVQSPGALPNP
jgi:hypothetical protein